MTRQNNKGNYTSRDIDILNILWDSDIALTASGIVDARPELHLTINTVQAVLGKLLRDNLIQIDNIVYSGTVLSRSYRPAITPADFVALQVTTEFQKLHKSVSKTALVAALLETESDSKRKLEEISQLEQMLEDYKKRI